MEWNLDHPSSYPFIHILDEVSIRYQPDSRIYNITFHKIIQNTSEMPLHCTYARVAVCIFPDDMALSAKYYRTRPLDLLEIGFRAFDSYGTKLPHQIVQQSDSNIELNIFFKNADSGIAFPAYKGEIREVFYSFHISEEQWGPFLERHVRCPTRTLRVRLSFPKDLVNVWGEVRSASGNTEPVPKEITKNLSGLWEDFIWELTELELLSRYRFMWAFADHRAVALRENLRQSFSEETKNDKGQFDVFLCHNSIDKPAVKAIGEKLKQQGLLPWLDEWELPPGRPWQILLEQQISQIRSAAVFVGQSGVGPWQNMEIRAFLSQFVKRDCPVIPVILPDCREAPPLPLFLTEITWVDFRKLSPDPIEQLLWGIRGTKAILTN